MKDKKIFILKISIAILVVLLIVISVSSWLWYDNHKKNEVLRLLNVTPVPSMKIERCHIEGAMDLLAMAKIVVDKEYLDAFLESSPFRNKKLTSDKEYFDASPPKWWKPNHAMNFLSCDFTDMEKAKSYKIYINLDDKEKAVVFVKVFEIY